MHRNHYPEADEDPLAAHAAEWVLRQDRGLTAVEQDELSQWLAADPRHRTAFAEHSRGWDELDRLAGLQASVQARPDPDLLAPPPVAVFPRRAWRLYAPLGLAAAAALILGLFFSRPAPPSSAPAAGRWAPVAPIEERLLTDGSEVQLNRGSVLTVEFTPSERRVRLVRGEAHFSVAKNPLRPFVVVAHGIEVQAVGTAFNVRLGSSAVEVLVTEGKVHVEHPDEHSPNGMSPATPLLLPGDCAVVPFSPATAQVAQLSGEQMAEQLAWQPRLLDFSDATLADIAAEFNRHNPVRLVLADPALGRVRLSASFRSDNIEGFVRLMESDFGMRAVRSDEAEISLQH
jgi:transmembrane sensor